MPDTASAGCWNAVGVHGDRSCRHLAQHVHCRNCPVYSAGGASLLDAPLPDGYRDHWAGHVARPVEREEAGLTSIVSFRLRHEWLALPTQVLNEVAGLRPIHSLPHRRGGVVLGLVNVRGELRTCVSLARLLGLDEAADDASAQARLLVAQLTGAPVAFVVDEVHGTQRYAARDLKDAPATVALAAAAYTRAVLPWRSGFLGLLDEQKLFHAIDRSLASASAI
jgi:chemotaxis-related protein WspD